MKACMTGACLLLAILSSAVFEPTASGQVTSFHDLYNFSTLQNGINNSAPHVLLAGLLLAGSTLYGTSLSGGIWTNGAFFGCSLTNGSPGTNDDGANPYGGLVLGGGTFYGTTRNGGPSGHGTVFALNPDGTGFTVLHAFTGGSDGAHPTSPLIAWGANTLYGTAPYGGDVADGKGFGVVFALNTDGSGFTILHTFSAADP